MSLTKLSQGGNNLINKLNLSDISAGDGNVANLFFTVYVL